MSQSADAETLRFYDNEAEAYCQRTGALPSPLLPSFLARLQPGASILELGGGSGRDTAEMLIQGYDVTPTGRLTGNGWPSRAPSPMQSVGA
jgi:ubiquinone/menaquinone biosynthesis C-methylase UbiE